jgi:hypothetical protein
MSTQNTAFRHNLNDAMHEVNAYDGANFPQALSLHMGRLGVGRHSQWQVVAVFEGPTVVSCPMLRVVF